MNMQITLNGNIIEISPNISLLDFLGLQGLEPDKVVIEYNFNILNKENWEKLMLKPNDNLEVLSFVGGG